MNKEQMNERDRAKRKLFEVFEETWQLDKAFESGYDAGAKQTLLQVADELELLLGDNDADYVLSNYLVEKRKEATNE